MTHDLALDGHILSLVQHNEIAEQSQLQKILTERGFNIPQSTLSRLLKKLKIAKVAGRYKIVDLNQSTLPLVLNAQVSDAGIIVLHTHPGHANILAYSIDDKYVTYSPLNPKDSGILGTISGDDTVMVIVKGKTELEKALAIIRSEFPYLKI